MSCTLRCFSVRLEPTIPAHPSQDALAYGDTPKRAPTAGIDRSTPAAQWAACAPLLAGAPRVRVATRRRSGIEYRARFERPLTSSLPLSAPAAVKVYGTDGTCRALCLDLDVSIGGPQQVARDASFLAKWLTECGARVITDVSPSGGQHIYVPLAQRLPYITARETVEALAMLAPSLDPGPHRSTKSGCIRVPGSLHKTGGHQQLITPLLIANDILHRPNTPDVVDAIRIRLRPQLAALAATTTPPQPTTASSPPRSPTDSPFSETVRHIAHEGAYDTTRYPSPSEARAAVMAGAARAGLTLQDVIARLEDGRWSGLAGLYAHHTDPRRRVITDWNAAHRLVSKTPPHNADHHSVQKSNTSGTKSQRGGRGTTSAHNQIRTWRAALRVSEQHRFPGRAGYAIRFVLRALGEFAHKTGSTSVEVGTRALALAAGLDHSTVSVLLRAAEDAGWCRRVRNAQGERADRYELTLPPGLEGQVEHLRWDRGKAHALRPAFRALGHVAALAFEALEQGRADSVSGLVKATGISRASVHEAVLSMQAWSLVERRDDGTLQAHPEHLARVAEHLGALELVANQAKRYTRQRRAWHAYLTRFDLTHADLDTYPPPAAWTIPDDDLDASLCSWADDHRERPQIHTPDPLVPV